MTSFEPLLSSPQAHSVVTELGYRVSYKRFCGMAAEGRLPSHKEGRYRYYRRSELVEWLRQRMDETSTPRGTPLSEGASQ
jgi:hypothetical protein